MQPIAPYIRFNRHSCQLRPSGEKNKMYGHRRQQQLRLGQWLRMLARVDFVLRPSHQSGKRKGGAPRSQVEAPPACFVLYGPNGCGKKHMLESACRALPGAPITIVEPDLVTMDWKRPLSDITTNKRIYSGPPPRLLLLISHFTDLSSMCKGRPGVFPYFGNNILPCTRVAIVLTCIDKPYTKKHYLPSWVPMQRVWPPNEAAIVHIIEADIQRLQRKFPSFHGKGWTARHIRDLAQRSHGNVLYALSQLPLPPPLSMAVVGAGTAVVGGAAAAGGIDCHSTNDFQSSEFFLRNRDLSGDTMPNIAARIDATFGFELLPMFVQQNYLLQAHGPNPRGGRYRVDSLERANWSPRRTAVRDAALAAEEISTGDMVSTVLRREQQYILQPYANFHACVAPMMLSHGFGSSVPPSPSTPGFPGTGIRHAFPAILGKMTTIRARRCALRRFQHPPPGAMVSMPAEDLREAFRDIAIPRIIKQYHQPTGASSSSAGKGILRLFTAPNALPDALRLVGMEATYKVGLTPVEKRRLTKALKVEAAVGASTYKKLSKTETAKRRRQREREMVTAVAKTERRTTKKKKGKKKKGKKKKKTNTLASYFTVKKRKIGAVRGEVVTRKRKRRRKG